ncbi:MAG TPA: hypothetical protein VK509_06560 [Polyangiales bacterium]|nr:hypothetical protein [Polyangiales bacterium]
MYEVDNRDRVVELGGVPPSDAGAPLPAVVSDELNVLVAYIVERPDPSWDGTYATMVGRETGDQSIAIIRFRSPRAHLFGPPNDEAFSGHPLYARGLRPYSSAEVQASSWIRKLERMNSVHPSHRPERYASDRHFILAFHDSTFECIAEGFDVQYVHGTMRGALEYMAKLVAEDEG